MPPEAEDGAESTLRGRLRETFDSGAELYHRVRPGYPAAAVDDLLASVPPAPRILEIGCGTGQLPVPLAEAGYAVTAIEPGTHLARAARRNLAPFPNVEVINADFETWTPPSTHVLVVAATSFHWLSPARRAGLVARALTPAGMLAILHSEHVAGGTGDFFADVQRCYERYMPGTPPDLRLLSPEESLPRYDDVTVSGLLQESRQRTYLWNAHYSTSDYLDLLSTYSGHIDLAADLRDSLFRCISALIDDRFGGRITKRYLTTLTEFRRKSSRE